MRVVCRLLPGSIAQLDGALLKLELVLALADQLLFCHIAFHSDFRLDPAQRKHRECKSIQIIFLYVSSFTASDACTLVRTHRSPRTIHQALGYLAIQKLKGSLLSTFLLSVNAFPIFMRKSCI